MHQDPEACRKPHVNVSDGSDDDDDDEEQQSKVREFSRDGFNLLMFHFRFFMLQPVKLLHLVLLIPTGTHYIIQQLLDSQLF